MEKFIGIRYVEFHLCNQTAVERIKDVQIKVKYIRNWTNKLWSELEPEQLLQCCSLSLIGYYYLHHLQSDGFRLSSSFACFANTKQIFDSIYQYMIQKIRVVLCHELLMYQHFSIRVVLSEKSFFLSTDVITKPDHLRGNY